MKVLTKLFMRSIKLIAKLFMDYLLNRLSNSIKLTTKLHFLKMSSKAKSTPICPSDMALKFFFQRL
jgi:hypothetical protein